MHPSVLMLRRALSVVLLLAVSLSAPPRVDAGAEARPFVSPMFGDHMVLQRGKANRLWGWTTPGAEVRVQIGDMVARAMPGMDGRWQAEFQPPAVGGPYEIRIDGPQTVTLRDVLVGDVWLCGGQSNMEFGLGRSLDGAEAVKQADHPRIRFYRVAPQPAYSPADVPQGAWTVCAPEAFAFGNGGFSAVAYFFARRLQQELDVPIGLIQDALGGTPAETWMSPAGLQAFPEFAPGLAETERLRTRGGPVHGNFIMHWYDEYDTGLSGATWAAEAHDDSAWARVSLRRGFAELGLPDAPAVAWFRREVELPDPLPAGVARLQLGVVERMDTAHINGQWIGASAWVENPRDYAIAEGVLRPGKNLVAIRVLKLKPIGGFISEAEKLRLVLGDGTAIPLEAEGAWRAALSVDASPPHPLPLGYDNWPTMPAVLHHGMIQPVAPLALTGVLWYQGEANFTRAHQYRTLLPAMIADWRATFGQGDLPFYIAQLPAYMARKAEPGDDWWAELRDAQAYAARTVANTALAVTVDTGEADDIHPKEKRPVGERLALCALRGTYGRDVVAAGPTLAGFDVMTGALRIHFSNTDGGLVVKGGQAGEFALAGADRKWAWAEARVEGDTIVVTSPAVAEPVAVRYAWQANPRATLFNGAGLPAAPFRSDDWPLSTEGRK